MKPFLAGALLLLSANSLFAQTDGPAAPRNAGPGKFYVRAGIGYGFVHGGQTHSGLDFPMNGTARMSGNTMTTEAKKASLGAGINGTLAFGYRINRNIGVELAAYSLFSPTNYTYEQSENSGFGQNSSTIETRSNNLLALIPSITLQTGGEVNFYARTGVVLPVGGSTRHEISNTSFSSEMEAEYKITHRFNAGLQGALGLSFAITPAFSVWVEGNAISLTQWAKKGEVVAYKEDGVNLLPFMDVADREINFETEYTERFQSTNPSPDQPSTGLSYSIPYSSIGLAIGVGFRF